MWLAEMMSPQNSVDLHQKIRSEIFGRQRERQTVPSYYFYEWKNL